MKTTLAWMFATALCAGTALGQEVKLKDGRVLYGKITRTSDTLQIETREGTVTIDDNAVLATREERELRAELRRLAAGTDGSAFAQLQLAVQARVFALEKDMWHHLDAAVEATPRDGSTLQTRLDDFLAQLEPELLARKWRAAGTEMRVRELLRQHRRTDGPGERAARLELLTREPNADKDLRTQARSNSDPQRRVLALEALVRRGTAGNDRFAWRTAILDRDDAVRAQSMALSRTYGITDGAVDYLAPGLMHSSAEVRVRTAEAYAGLADQAAIKLLVLAGPNAGKALSEAGSGVRAHVAFLQQQAYVRDFDVEVAQASFIADPKIGILQSGTVLDVTVHGVSEERIRIVRAFRSSLQGLAGSDPGADPRAWPTWLMRQQQPAPPAPTTPRDDGR
ncbi:MAG: hypothetical protein AB7O97_09470 [Planctomycetota bacterium]